MFRVYQDGKPADCRNFDVHKSWNCCEFENFEDAVVYVIKWAYPVDDDTVYSYAQDGIKSGYFKPNTPRNMSMGPMPVIMEIREET